MTKPRFGLNAVAIVAAWLLTVLGGVWAASAMHAGGMHAVRDNTADIADHETRLRVTEQQQAAIAADVGWIRATMEKAAP